jgi:hypothetical protein
LNIIQSNNFLLIWRIVFNTTGQICRKESLTSSPYGFRFANSFCSVVDTFNYSVCVQANQNKEKQPNA